MMGGIRMIDPSTATAPSSTAAEPTPVAAQRPVKFNYLVAQRFLSREQLAAAVAEAKERHQSVESLLIDKYGVRKGDLGTSLSLFYRCPFVPFDRRTIVSRDLLTNLNVQHLKKAAWIPLRREGDTVTVLVKDPHDLPLADSIEKLFPDSKIRLAVSLPDDIQQFINSATGADTQAILSEGGDQPDNAAPDADDFTEVSDHDHTVIRLAHQIILDAFRERASDIHIEPGGRRRQTTVRFRVDGTCFPYQEVPSLLSNPLVARLKIMANLDITERRKPQDGKLRVRLPERDIELRIATIPTVGGNEDVVLRLLAAQDLIPLEAHGLAERNFRELTLLAQKPYGLILCVGPTGSGKTTTLHAILRHINTAEKKIWTAEDPVEITQHGLRQVQVNRKIGFTFAAAMRAFLRGDPDIIMVGEMRDSETTGIAIEASLTGHLVLSTLHTNSAVETIGRLLDLGIDPFNFADALLGVLAQRLVKRLCMDCKRPYEASPEEMQEMAMAYGPEFSRVAPPAGRTLHLYQSKGCDRCNGTGYRGRAAIHELLVASDYMKTMINRRQPMLEILDQAKAEGMTTLVQDGIMKVLAGVTDFKQVKVAAIR
jgi:type II secretory ATPase GspE/PulE/Tfp pilus assembly ATPase PilB-like protein